METERLVLVSAATVLAVGAGLYSVGIQKIGQVLLTVGVVTFVVTALVVLWRVVWEEDHGG